MRLASTQRWRIALILCQRDRLVLGLQQMAETGQGAFAGVGVEHIGDGDIGVA